MRCLHFLAIALLIATATHCPAQTLLKNLEDQLQGAPGGAVAAPAAQPYLGFVPDEEATTTRGVPVKEVKPGGPSDQGGLKAGDVIIGVEAKAVLRLTDLDAVLDKVTPGQKLRMMVDRGGKQQTLNITVGTKAPPASEQNPGEAAPPPAATPAAPGAAPATELAAPSLLPPSNTSPAPATPSFAPAPAPAAATPPAAEAPAPAPAPIRSRPADAGQPPAETPPAGASELPAPAPAGGGGASLGITVVPLTDEARAAYGLTVRRGALITGVRPGSPADRAGLPMGGVVVAVDGRRVDSADDLVGAIRAARAGQEVELTYYEGDRLSRKMVRLAPAGGGVPPREGPLGSGFGAPGGDRNFLNQVEKIVDGLAPPRGPSTVYNPRDLAALQARVTELTEQLKAMEARLRALEGKTSGTGAAASAPSGPASAAAGGSFVLPGNNP
jgi:hypothetical protein